MDAVLTKFFTTLAIFVFIVFPIFIRNWKSISGPSKELRKRAEKADNDYINGPAVDKAIAKPQGRYAQKGGAQGPAKRLSPAGRTASPGSAEPKPWQVGKHDVTKQASAFGESRDAVAKESMAASNARYVDVGNDYVSGFDVDGRRETPSGFDR